MYDHDSMEGTSCGIMDALHCFAGLLPDPFSILSCSCHTAHSNLHSDTDAEMAVAWGGNDLTVGVRDYNAHSILGMG